MRRQGYTFLVLLCGIFFWCPLAAEIKSGAVLIPVSHLKVKPFETVSGQSYVSYDKKTLLLRNDTGSYSATFTVYDLVNNKKTDSFSFNGFMIMTDFKADSKVILIEAQVARPGNPSKAVVYNVATKTSKTFIASSNEKDKAHFSIGRDGRFLAVMVKPFGEVNAEGSLQIYNAVTGEKIAVFSAEDCDFSPDGGILTVESKKNNTHVVYNIAKRKVLDTFKYSDEIRFSRDGKSMTVTEREGGVISLYDTASGDKLKKFRGAYDYFSQDSRYYVVQEKESGKITVFDITKDRVAKTVKGNTSGFVPNANLWFAVDRDANAARLYDTAAWEEKKTIKGTAVNTSDDGKVLIVGDKNAGKADIYNGMTLELLNTFNPEPAFFDRASAKFSPDNKMFIIHGKDWKSIMVLDALTGKLIFSMGYNNNSFSVNLDFSPDGRFMLVSGSTGKPPLFYDIQNRTVIKEFSGGEWPALTPDWKKIAVADAKEKATTLYDTATFKKISTIKGIFPKILSNGNMLLLSDYGAMTISLYDISKLQGVTDIDLEKDFRKEEFETTREHEERLRSLSYSYKTTISIGKYNADKSGFEGDIQGNKVFVRMSRAKAKNFNAKTDIFYVEGKLRYFDSKNIEFAEISFTDKETGDKFAVSKWIEGPSVAYVPYVPKPAVKEALNENIHEIPDFKASPRDNDFAIVIGIENYQAIPKSDYSKSDAGIVKDYLKAIGFRERNIELIIDEKATKSGIEKALEAWLPNRAKKDSRVVVYYSGHGAPDPVAGDAYIMPYDGDPNYLSITAYPLKRLYEKLGRLQVSEVIVILDACFSGAGGRSVLAKGARPLVMLAEMPNISSNVAVLSATSGTQISTSSPEKGHGLFTYYFIKALKDGKKSVNDIYRYIKPLVEDEAKTLNVQQSPAINMDLENLSGRFFLVQ